MSDRSVELMMRALDQLDEAAQLLEQSTESQLRRPYKETADGHSATTVGGAAIHFAQGYGKLGKFLNDAGYISAADRFAPSGAQGGGHGPHGGHGAHGGGGHGAHGFAGESQLKAPDVIKTLDRAREIVGLFEELSDEQLDSVPSVLGEWSDGRRTLGVVLETLVDHQSEHLESLREAFK